MVRNDQQGSSSSSTSGRCVENVEEKERETMARNIAGGICCRAVAVLSYLKMYKARPTE